MLIIGSARAVNIFISIVRVKVLAVLLGPSGLGLLSIYNSLQGMVNQTAGLGIASSGVREIASARGEEAILSRVRRVLFAAHLVQGALALLAVWLLREPISTWLFGDANRATEVGLVGVTILFALLSSAQTALLQGLRRIGDLARVTVIGAIVGTVAGLLAVWLQGESGLIWFILVQPLATVIVALHFTRQLPKPSSVRLTFREMWQVWKPMAWLGAAFMLGGLATTATLLLVRARISQELGLEAAGHFAAAWGVSMTYVGFMLGAMGADYYPRLAEVIKDRSTSIELVNDQAQLALAIGGPVMLLLIGLGPLVILLLYSNEFGAATTILQWQTVGNVFKLASWPLGFVVVAQARNKTFMFLQIHWNAIFLLVLWASLSTFGIAATGPAFATACIIQFFVVLVIVRRVIDFRWQSLSLGMLGMHTGLALGLFALALTAPLVAAVVSPLLAAGTGLLGLRIVLIKTGPQGRAGRRFSSFFTKIGWPIRSTP
jgi:O-antigen/teichoic acid export membrane protein